MPSIAASFCHVYICPISFLLLVPATTTGTEKLSLNMIKILLQVCLTTLNVVCWFVPMKIRRFVESERAISMANAFSGGVFLSLAFGETTEHI